MKVKRFVLFCGGNYYPNGGWNDHSGSFDTLEEAKAEARRLTGGEPWLWTHVERPGLAHVGAGARAVAGGLPPPPAAGCTETLLDLVGRHVESHKYRPRIVSSPGNMPGPGCPGRVDQVGGPSPHYSMNPSS